MLSAMTGLARLPRSYGFTLTNAGEQAPKEHRKMAVAVKLNGEFMFVESGRSSLAGQEFFDFRRVFRFGLSTAEAGVDIADDALAISQVAGGHGWRAEEISRFLRGVMGEGEFRTHFTREFFVFGSVVIHAHADDHQAFCPVFFVESVECRE